MADSGDFDSWEKLLDKYGTDNPDHPMTGVLKDGLGEPPEPKRRGGRKARVGN